MLKKVVVIVTVLLISTAGVAGCCTVFTASVGDTVLFGNNEDWPDTNTRVWFLPATETEYGGVYFGFSDFYAQGGMNDQGLCFDANAIPETRMKPHPEKLLVLNFGRRILQQCATVEEAIQIIERYDLSGLGKAQFLFADKTGDSMAVCPGPHGEMEVVRKEGVYQVTTNFNVLNPWLGGYPCWRYNAAAGMLRKIENENDLTVEYFASILKAVYQRHTTYSTIYDPVNRIVYVYNQRNFDEVVVLNLEDELEKGYHAYYIPLLFPRKQSDQELGEPEAEAEEQKPEEQEPEEPPKEEQKSEITTEDSHPAESVSFSDLLYLLSAIVLIGIGLAALLWKKRT
ncbi:MAG: hypothetical protein AYK18_13370 [Theionarchaea archaeon DG-70]|nr:MAG: hypothetical protein AYK18_13370 [Theionarchaea archaeon DG-70]